MHGRADAPVSLYLKGRSTKGQGQEVVEMSVARELVDMGLAVVVNKGKSIQLTTEQKHDPRGESCKPGHRLMEKAVIEGRKSAREIFVSYAANLVGRRVPDNSNFFYEGKDALTPDLLEEMLEANADAWEHASTIL